MQEKIRQFLNEAGSFSAQSAEELEQFRLRFLSKKGVIAELFEEFKQIPGIQKKETGLLLNELKNKIQEKIDSLKSGFEDQNETEVAYLDLTRPDGTIKIGARHPLSIVRNQIIEIFSRIGFTVAEDREIEDDWHNFTALNFPAEHPARDMQDTFFISKDPDIALRTHTSSVQIRMMEKTQPPMRMIFPGRVFRNEAISARAHCIFHQVEG
ncbi:MAG: phenylalanine--tRNA ligase subunit alpha, partial [Bacteroidota bacterium]